MTRKRRGSEEVEPGCATGGGEVSASGPMFWIARAGGQKVTIRGAQRGRWLRVPTRANFFRFFHGKRRNPPALPPVEEAKGDRKVPKPPATPPSSDLDGVHEDEEKNIDSARRVGQDTSDLARAANQSAGKPDYSDEKSRDDRSS